MRLLFMSLLLSASISASAANRHELYQMAKDIENGLPWSNMNNDQMDQAEKHLQAVKDLIVEATPIPATLSLSGEFPYIFATITTGATSSHTFTVTNTGTTTATAMTVMLGGLQFSFSGGTSPGTGGTCGSALNAGSSCTIVINYAPKTTGTSSSVLSIEYNDGSSQKAISLILEGSATVPAALSISDGSTYNFGPVSVLNSAEHVFEITNSGGTAATSMMSSGLTAPITFKGGSYPGVGGTCGTTLVAASSCTIIVTFAPTTQATYNESVSIFYNDGASSQTSARPLTGISF